MPSSHLYQIQQILDLILFTDPHSLLDVGVGFGKYGFLAREYLELWGDDKVYSHRSRRIDGIEVFDQYLTPVHSFIYDNIYVGNAIEVIPKLDVHYDLLLLIDVLEHFEHDEGLEMLGLCKSRARNIIVSTPIDTGTQGRLFGNPHEEHKSQWTKQKLNKLPDVYFLDNEYSLLCYVGDHAQKLKRARLNRRVGRFAPFLVPIVKRIKGFSRG